VHEKDAVCDGFTGVRPETSEADPEPASLWAWTNELGGDIVYLQGIWSFMRWWQPKLRCNSNAFVRTFCPCFLVQVLGTLIRRVSRATCMLHVHYANGSSNCSTALVHVQPPAP
jgi:hypothetical protein